VCGLDVRWFKECIGVSFLVQSAQQRDTSWGETAGDAMVIVESGR
jgi:hypothetical protein